MSAIWNPSPVSFFDENGLLASGAKAYFYYAGTSTALTVYTSSALTTAHAVPVVANAIGVFAPIYLPYVDYRVRVVSSDGVELYNADNISNPAPAVAAVDSGRIVTGMPFWWLSSIAPDGYVRMNGRTIGPSGSAATEYANDLAEDLYTFLYGLDDAIATVSGGRGANAAADWAAAKPIVVPTMQGIVAAGVEGMGATAENRVQIAGTCDVTNASANITVTSATGLARGMTMIIDGTDAGTITAISGTTVTLSGAYAGGTDTGLSYRASMFSDAQTIGLLGGVSTVAQTIAEMAQHNHVLNDPGHTHQYNNASGGALGASFGGFQNLVQTGSATTGITMDNRGQGLPSTIIQPTRLGTYIIKL